MSTTRPPRRPGPPPGHRRASDQRTADRAVATDDPAPGPGSADERRAPGRRSAGRGAQTAERARSGPRPTGAGPPGGTAGPTRPGGAVPGQPGALAALDTRAERTSRRPDLQVVRPGRRMRTGLLGGLLVSIVFVTLFLLAAMQAVLVQGQLRLDQLQGDLASASRTETASSSQVNTLESPDRLAQAAHGVGHGPRPPGAVPLRRSGRGRRGAARPRRRRPTRSSRPGRQPPPPMLARSAMSQPAADPAAPTMEPGGCTGPRRRNRWRRGEPPGDRARRRRGSVGTARRRSRPQLGRRRPVGRRRPGDPGRPAQPPAAPAPPQQPPAPGRRAAGHVHPLRRAVRQAGPAPDGQRRPVHELRQGPAHPHRDAAGGAGRHLRPPGPAARHDDHPPRGLVRLGPGHQRPGRGQDAGRHPRR